VRTRTSSAGNSHGLIGGLSLPDEKPDRIAQPAFGQFRGFTLLELVVVLALATLLIALVPPLISSAIPGVELKSSARLVASGLRLAREEAIRTGREVAFTLNLEDRSYQVEGPFRFISLPKGLDLKLIAAESEMQNDQLGSIRFFADGGSTGGRVILARNGSGWQVGTQWLTGRVEIAPWEGP